MISVMVTLPTWLLIINVFGQTISLSSFYWMKLCFLCFRNTRSTFLVSILFLFRIEFFRVTLVLFLFVMNLLFIGCRRSLVLQPNTIPTRNLQLIFASKLPSTLFTNSKVEDEDHDPLKIQLVDAASQCVIDHGSLSGTKIKIEVLNGDFVADGREDWSENEFNDNIVREREGKRPLLVGDISFVLVGGVGYIQNITFTDNSSWLRSRKFRLGVRVVSRASFGTGIREAVSEAFMVLDHRGECKCLHSFVFLDV